MAWFGNIVGGGGAVLMECGVVMEYGVVVEIPKWVYDIKYTLIYYTNITRRFKCIYVQMRAEEPKGERIRCIQNHLRAR